MSVSYLPKGRSHVSPYLIIPEAQHMLDFLKRVFDATELDCHKGPDGAVMHAEVRIGDSVIMMGQSSDAFPPMPCMVHIYVPDADAVYARAIAAGATSVREPTTQFYGDRSGGVLDYAGNQWWMATHVEDVSSDEMFRRMSESKG